MTTKFRRLTPADAHALIARGGVTVLDSRDAATYERGHIEGAQRLDRDSLGHFIATLPKAAPLLIYCYHGNASQTYANMFADFRFTDVYDLIGGYEAWRAHIAATALAAAAAPRTAPLSAALGEWLHAHQFPADDVNAAIANGITPLMQAARLGATDIAAELLAAGADMTVRNTDGNQALWFACFAGSVPTIQLLAKAGIDVDNQNDNGATCLMYAASAGKHEVVAALLLEGADIELKTVDDFTALDMAATFECLQLLRAAERASTAAASS
jgi:thiosulfate/3-mercaptopyruvate sulfurtransferase